MNEGHVFAGPCSRMRIDAGEGGRRKNQINQTNHIIYTVALRLSIAWNDLNIFMSKRFIFRVRKNEKCSRETCTSDRSDATALMFRSESLFMSYVSSVCSTTFNPTKSASSHVQSVSLHKQHLHIWTEMIFFLFCVSALFLCVAFLSEEWCDDGR